MSLPKFRVDEEEEEMNNLSWLVTSSADKLLKSVGYGLLDDPPAKIEKIMYDPDFRYTKPGHTYTELIEKALREKKRLTVSELYAWIHANYPYFKENDGRWKNSVRHNLSISPQFKKEGKSKHGAYFWVLSEEYEEEMRKMNEVRKVISEAKKKQLEMRAAKRAARKKQEKQPLPSRKSPSSDPLLIDAATDILRGVQRKVLVKYMDDVSGSPTEDESTFATQSLEADVKSEMEFENCEQLTETEVIDEPVTFFTDVYGGSGIEVFNFDLEGVREEEVCTSLMDDSDLTVTIMSLYGLCSSGSNSSENSLCTTDEGIGDEISENSSDI